MKRFLSWSLVVLMLFGLVACANVGAATTSFTGLRVTMIDVGQADSLLIQCDGHSMLIDAGNNADGANVVDYIKKQGVQKLDYVVGTHPHEDHIGGLDNVILALNIGKIFLPKVSNTTKTFQDVLSAAKAKKLTITSPPAGTKFTLGKANCTVFAPSSATYKDINDYSIVIKVTYGSVSELFLGDANKTSIQEMMVKGYDLRAQVIKIGHHGSSTSTSAALLKKVAPSYAMMSVGVGNIYGHPTKQTMDLLKGSRIPVYRTDQNGTVVMTSDGEKITFSCKPGDYSYAKSTGGTPKPTTTKSPVTTTIIVVTATPIVTVRPTAKPTTGEARTVYFTPTGKSYHFNRNCSALARSKTVLSGTLSEAIAQGHSDPCDLCAK